MQQQFKRRLFYGTNVVVAVVLAIALVAGLNFLVLKYPLQHDFIQAKDLYKLSDKTKKVLATLSNTVEFFIFSNVQSSELGAKVERLLRTYEAESPRVKVVMVDSLRDVQSIRKLVKDLSVDEPDTVVVKYGEQKTLLTEMKLADFKFNHNEYTGGQDKKLVALKAEQAFTSAIVGMISPKREMARFTVLHGERELSDDNEIGMSEVKRYFDRDNIDAEPLRLVGVDDLSATNCDLLVVAGPTKPFREEELNLVRRYLTRGGKALFLLDPENETKLEPLLAEFNVKVGNDIVVDPGTRSGAASLLMLVVAEYGYHPITKALRTYTQFPVTRSVRILDEKNDVNEATVLAETTESGWGETSTQGDRFKYDANKDIKGPVGIAVAVENKKTGMRLVVVGDADFACNRSFSQETGNFTNRDLLLNAANWAMQREFLVNIGPKSLAEVRRLRLTKRQFYTISFAVLGAAPLAAALSGVLVYFFRRK